MELLQRSSELLEDVLSVGTYHPKAGKYCPWRGSLLEVSKCPKCMLCEVANASDGRSRQQSTLVGYSVWSLLRCRERLLPTSLEWWAIGIRKARCQREHKKQQKKKEDSR